MLRKKIAGADSEGRHLLAVRFDLLEPGHYFAFHESGQVMYRKHGRGTAERGITIVHVSPEQQVHALGDVTNIRNKR